jgi:hypothetical protein
MWAKCRYCSLIPGLGVKALRAHPCRAHCSLRGRVNPPHDGVRRRWWINVASAVSLGRELPKYRTISPPPPSRQGRLFPPRRGNPGSHSGECHTPRNLAFALDNRKKFAGTLTAGWRLKRQFREGHGHWRLARRGSRGLSHDRACRWSRYGGAYSDAEIAALANCVTARFGQRHHKSLRRTWRS